MRFFGAIFYPDYDGRAPVREWQFMQGTRPTDQARRRAPCEAIPISQSVAKVKLALVAPIARHKAPP